MSDTPCVCGCAQDAATIERLRAERDRLRAIVTEAALETYTPDGSERFVAEFHRVLAENAALRDVIPLAMEAASFAKGEAQAGGNSGYASRMEGFRVRFMVALGLDPYPDEAGESDGQ